MKCLLLAFAALLPLLCFAQPANDGCSGAIAIPVNPGTAATSFVTGNFNNATGGTTGFCFSPYNDLWYHFTAVNTLHLLKVSNVTQVSALYIEARSGSCTGGYVYCGSSDLPAMGALLSNLVPGQEYYVRVYTEGYTVPTDTTFQLSITSAGPAISTSNTAYTTTQLVEDVLAAQPGLAISNITSSTGSDLTATDPNGIAYFETPGDIFPFQNGVVLSTGNALNATGPNSYTVSGGGFSWPGDEDLDEVINEFEPTFISRNATSLEFDFVPSYDQLSLNFIFASEEYGDFQCTFSDSFAILLTDTATGAVYNLAVIPGSATPISVSTVRNMQYNELCPSVNPQYFGQYYTPYSLEGPINYNGQTVAFNATTTVLPGGVYHLKIVIADRADPVGDSALFLQGGSFNIGEPLYDGPYVVFDNLEPYETCEENTDGLAAFNLDWVEYIVDVVGDPNSYTYTCYATEANAQQGINPLPSTYTNTTPYEQTIYVKVSPIDNPVSFDIAPLVLKVYDMPVGTPGDYYVCDENNDGIAVFDLTSQVELLYGPNAGDYFFSYYETEEGANAGGFYADNPEAYHNLTNPQTVYVRAENGMGACVTYTTLTLHAQPATTIDNLPAIAVCSFTDTADVTVNATAALDPLLYTTSYHTTETDAYDDTNPIPNPQSYSPQNQEGAVVWVRIVNQLTGCVKVLPQELQLWENLINVTVDESNAAIWFAAVAPGFEYTLALNGQPTTQTSFTIEDLNYCSNVLTVTNTTCNVTADFFFEIHPPAPTGPSPQAFTEGQTLADLEVEGTGISWFTAAMGGTYLPPDIPLVDGATYYAAQLIENCAGIDRLPVTVYLSAGLADNTLASLRCYPNPVNNELKLEHTATLLGATLYNTLGQEVATMPINNTKATLNLTALASGVYLLQVQAEGGERVIKVIKN